jgi:hypothetical protein
MESLRALPDSAEVRVMQRRLDELTRRRVEEEEP